MMVPRTHLRVGTHTCMANIWGAHGGDCGDYLPEYKAAQLDRYLPRFRRKALPHFLWHMEASGPFETPSNLNQSVRRYIQEDNGPYVRSLFSKGNALHKICRFFLC